MSPQDPIVTAPITNPIAMADIDQIAADQAAGTPVHAETSGDLYAIVPDEYADGDR